MVSQKLLGVDQHSLLLHRTTHTNMPTQELLAPAKALPGARADLNQAIPLLPPPSSPLCSLPLTG